MSFPYYQTYGISFCHFPQGEIPFFFPCCRTIIWPYPFYHPAVTPNTHRYLSFSKYLISYESYHFILCKFTMCSIPVKYRHAILTVFPIIFPFVKMDAEKYSENSLLLFLMHIVLVAHQNWHPHRRQKVSDIREVKMSVKRKHDYLWTHMFFRLPRVESSSRFNSMPTLWRLLITVFRILLQPESGRTIAGHQTVC